MYRIKAAADKYGYWDSLVEYYEAKEEAQMRAAELETILRDKLEHCEIADFTLFIMEV